MDLSASAALVVPLPSGDAASWLQEPSLGLTEAAVSGADDRHCGSQSQSRQFSQRESWMAIEPMFLLLAANPDSFYTLLTGDPDFDTPEL